MNAAKLKCKVVFKGDARRSLLLQIDPPFAHLIPTVSGKNTYRSLSALKAAKCDWHL